MSTQILDRLDRMEREITALQRELRQIRATVTTRSTGGETGVRVAAAPIPQRAPVPTRAPMPPLEPAIPPPKRERPKLNLPQFDVADLVGARGLALAGGVVTLLGVVFFFVLAANNGWIGPLARVLLGGGASALVFASAIVLQARYGRLHASVASAGAGIAGGYATLLAAAALYDLVPPVVALVLAATIAAIGVALSLLWSSEVVAGLGLIGAMVVPGIVVLDGSLTTTGTAFVAIVFAAAAAVAIRHDWLRLLIVAAIVSAPQILALVLAEDEPARGRVVALAFVFVVLYAGVGVVRQLATAAPRLDSLASLLIAGAALLGLSSSFALLEGDSRGVALAVLTTVFGAVAVGFWRDATRELGALAAVFATAYAATATAQLLDGPALVVAWAVEAVALAWLGRRLAETRFQLVSLAYLTLALAYTLGHEAPPDTLYERGAGYLAGVPALAAVGLALVAFGVLARTWPPNRSGAAMPALLAQLVGAADANRRELGLAAAGLGILTLVDAGSLALLDLFERSSVLLAFEWGHVGVTVLWSAVALSALTAGLLRGSRLLELSGVAGLGLALVSFELFSVPDLPDHRGWCALVLAVASASGALLHGLLAERTGIVSAGGVALSAALSGFVCVELFAGDARGYALTGAAGAHLAIAAAVYRRRDLSTCFWFGALVLGLGSSIVLLDHTWLVLAWALTAATLAAAGALLPEPRLWLGSVTFLVLGAGLTLAQLATAEDFFSANGTPADGVPALLLVLGGLIALAFSLRQLEPIDALDRLIDESVEQAGRALRWALAVLGLYGASLAILGLVQEASGATITTAFQRGHTAVSAFWGAVALAALVLGLRRSMRTVRLAALGLFAIALGKLFIYDLSTLSSVTRALSFLAVGGVLLLAGFFYQRFSETETETET